MGRLNPGDSTDEVLSKMAGAGEGALEVLQGILGVTFNLGSSMTPEQVIGIMDEFGLYGDSIIDLYKISNRDLVRLIALLLCVKSGEFSRRFLEVLLLTKNRPMTLTPGAAIARIRDMTGFENFGK